MNPLLPALLIAQAATCGIYGTPASPGGCSLPAPDGGRYLLQNTYGQLHIQQTGPRFQPQNAPQVPVFVPVPIRR